MNINEVIPIINDDINIISNTTDFSTETKQDALNTLITNLIWVTNALYDVSTKLNVLSWVTWTVADLRVTPLSLPTLWTVTTVWTLTNQTNIGWFIASTTIQDKMNANAYLNNISNISIW